VVRTTKGNLYLYTFNSASRSWHGPHGMNAVGLVAAGASDAAWASVASRMRELSAWLAAGGEAVRVAQAATTIHRELANAHPDNVDYQQQLAWSLHELVARLQQAGRQAEAQAISAAPARFGNRLTS
jgi:hypothetical protein